jgi:site-specific recombinase XerD
MATIKTVLRKTPLSSGKFPVLLRITKDRKSKFFGIPFDSTLKEWNKKSGRFNKNNPNFTKANLLIGKIENRALEVITDLELHQDFFTLPDFENNFRINSNPVIHNVFNFWQEIINEMISAGRIGNANVNQQTRKSLIKFNNNSTDLNFKQITPELLYKYEAFFRSRGGTDGGIGVKMRALRSIINLAINRGYALEKNYPFKNYKVSKLKGKGIKKALNIEEIREIESLDLIKYPNLRDSKNFFIFSFYTRGMNFADVMKLKWSEVTQDRIHYTRSKTKGNFIIKIMPPVQEILDYYEENQLQTSYVFPILLSDRLTPTQINYRKHKCLKKFNKDLKEIAQVCKINKPISSYVARHSFANCLKQKGVSTDVISESMGHQDIATTKAYLKELDSGVLDEANELLLT